VGVIVFFQKNILIPNIAEKNILILVEEKKNILIQREMSTFETSCGYDYSNIHGLLILPLSSISTLT
jgi:hypothetical protein